jgi:hypothetical protein
MPYVDQGVRAALDSGVSASTPGELNYKITTICEGYLALKSRSYTTLNEIIGALECAKLEYYRRILTPYEDQIYVAGPMTGLPKFNVPAFDRQAGRLRRNGYTVVSPAELDSPTIREALLASPDGTPTAYTSQGETWADFLARDVKLIGDVIDAICVLPGWSKSRGARLEVFVALLCGKPILEDYNYAEATDQIHIVEMAKTDVVFAIARSFL